MEVKQRSLLVSGDNDFGQLCTGNNKPTKKLIEPKLPPEVAIQQVAVGYDHTLILTETNELYVCGSNAYGKLGMGKNVEEITKLTRVDFSHLLHHRKFGSYDSGSSNAFVSTPTTSTTPNLLGKNSVTATTTTTTSATASTTTTTLDSTTTSPATLPNLPQEDSNNGLGMLSTLSQFGSMRLSSTSLKKQTPGKKSPLGRLFESTSQDVAANDFLELQRRKRPTSGGADALTDGGNSATTTNDSSSIISSSAPVTTDTYLITSENVIGNRVNSPIEGSNSSESPMGSESLDRDSTLNSIVLNNNNITNNNQSNPSSATPLSATTHYDYLFDSSKGRKHKKSSTHHQNIANVTSPQTEVGSGISSSQIISTMDGEEVQLSVSGENNERVNIHQHGDDSSLSSSFNTSPNIIISSGGSSELTATNGNNNSLSNSSTLRRNSDAIPPTHRRNDSSGIPTINTNSVKTLSSGSGGSSGGDGGGHSAAVTERVSSIGHSSGRSMGSFDFDSIGSDPSMTPMSEDDLIGSLDDETHKRHSGGLKPFGSVLIKQRKTSNANPKDLVIPRLKSEAMNDARVQLDFLKDIAQQTTPQTARGASSSEKTMPPFEIKSIYCSRNNSFILTKDDEIYMCGERSSCYFKRLQDEELEGKKIKLFGTSPFSDHFLIVTSQQEVLVSGNNSNGQLGDGTTLDCYGFLKKIKFDFGEDYSDEEKKYVDFKFVACGRAHTCIVATLNGNFDVFYSTGNNQFSQLGYALPLERSEFENPPSLPFERQTIKDLACGAQHTMVLTMNGELWACGKGDLGQLGNGSYSPKNEFQKIDLSSSYMLRRVFCGGGFTVLLTNDNTILRTGGNYYGQSFQGSTEMSCEYKEQKMGSSLRVYTVHPTTLFCIIQVTKTLTTSSSRRTSRTAETPTESKNPTFMLKPGMFGSKSKTNLTLNLGGITSKLENAGGGFEENFLEDDDDLRPKTTR
nr:unnamed protein product [Naegleria fowleri]